LDAITEKMIQVDYDQIFKIGKKFYLIAFSSMRFYLIQPYQ